MALIPIEITLHLVFLAGVALVVLLTRRREPDPAARMKLLIYYGIVQAVILSTLNRAIFITLASAVIAGAAIEILRLKVRVIPFIVFIPVAAGFLAFSLKLRMSTIRLCYLLVAIFDFASEIGGRIFGRTRLLPTVSPGKTVEGLAAGLFTVFSVTAVLSVLGFNGVQQPYLLTAIVTAAAFFGDMLASLCKRRNGIKDFSSTIPAHGGILDRFDSFVFSAAVVFLFSFVTA